MIVNNVLAKDFIKYLKDTYKLNYIYPTIPPSKNGITNTPTGCFIYQNTINPYTNEGLYYIQFITASKIQLDAETISKQLLDFFLDTQLAGSVINNTTIIDVILLNSTPILIGTDSENRFKYSFNIKVLLKN